MAEQPSRKLIVTKVEFITEEGDDTDQLNDELKSTGMIRDWPVYTYTREEANDEQIDWFITDYLSLK